MSTAFDALVIGGGIAGATAAYHQSADRTVALVEAEEAAGYHTSGRSAALWVANGGPEYERGLALASFDAAFLPYRQKRALREAAAREITPLLADAPAITEAA